MIFKVVFATSQGTATKKYKGTDSYEFVRGGILRIDAQKPSGRGIHHFPPGQWIEVVEQGAPITPSLESDG